MEKKLWIIRGVPGSGKTTTAEALAALTNAPVFSADHFFEKKDADGKVVSYNFDASKLFIAHRRCFDKTASAMSEGVANIFVANTFVAERDLKEYVKLAEEHGYAVFSLVVENRHGNKSIHDVPDAKVEEMRKKFSIKI